MQKLDECRMLFEYVGYIINGRNIHENKGSQVVWKKRLKAGGI